jgi:hypothetical protein
MENYQVLLNRQVFSWQSYQSWTRSPRQPEPHPLQRPGSTANRQCQVHYTICRTKVNSPTPDAGLLQSRKETGFLFLGA